MIETDTICTAHHVKPELLINRKEHTFSRFYEALLTIQAKAFDFKAIADTNNVEIKAIFIPFVLINALHNLN